MLFHPTNRSGSSVPICEICGMEVVEVFECSRCNSKFCSECGDLADKRCYDCVGWSSEELEDSSWEDEGWSDSWNDDEPH